MQEKSSIPSVFLEICSILNLIKCLKMNKKYPNASILTFITQSDKLKSENLLFIYLKPIPDFLSNDKVSWYEGHGKNGLAKDIWKKQSIKQWVACGKDNIIQNLFERIFKSNILEIDNREISLVIPSFTKDLFDIEKPNGREKLFDSYTTMNNELIPEAFFQKENLEYLSGYKTGSKEIKPLFPLCFFENNFIYDNLKKNTWGIREYRTPYLTFRGASEKTGKEELVGFYQQNFNPNFDYFINVKNENGEEIGNNKINKTNGTFRIDLSEPAQKGKVEIFSNNMKEKNVDFVLLNNINFGINAQMAHTEFTDIYGRKFLITNEKSNRPEKAPNFTWQRDIYADTKEADKKLSDLFKSLLDYLGPKVLIADPYFLGEVKEDINTKKFYFPFHCQQAFVNALFHSALEKNIIQINILGSWARAKKLLEHGTIEMYEVLFKSLILINKLEIYLPKSSIQFRNTIENFHNRYWFSLIVENGIEIIDKCVIITNSLGNIEEVDIIPVVDEAQLRQITRKYTGIFKNADIKLEI